MRRVFPHLATPRSPVSQRVVLKPADLDVVAVHVVHVQAAGAAVADVLDPERGELGPGAVAVEIGTVSAKGSMTACGAGFGRAGGGAFGSGVRTMRCESGTSLAVTL